MAWYRSIVIDTPDVKEPEFINEYSYFIVQREAVTQTFTVVNPGLYFLLATGVAVGTSATYPFTFSINSSNTPVYIQYFGGYKGRYAFIQLDAGDTITYTADSSSRTDFSKKQAFLAARITNATFVSRYSTKESRPFTYTPPSDNNMHLTLAVGSSIRWGGGDVTDTTIIPEECNAIKVGSAEQNLVVYAIGSVNDAVYINLAGDMYGGTVNISDFILQPMSKIAGTLPAGQSTITLYDQRIRSDSHISAVYAETWYLDITVNDGSCTIEFPVQDTDMDVEIEVE